MTETPVRCTVCREVVLVPGGNTSPLLQHMRCKHPCLKTAFFDSVPAPSKATSAPQKPECDGQVVDMKTAYVTTVETWKPGCSPVTCPRCLTTSQPIAKRQVNKVCKTFFGAFGIMLCWPLCVLPCMLLGSKEVCLYCSHCGCFLGTPDHLHVAKPDPGCPKVKEGSQQYPSRADRRQPSPDAAKENKESPDAAEESRQCPDNAEENKETPEPTRKPCPCRCPRPPAGTKPSGPCRCACMREQNLP
ncbi:uncharacterized protein LOC134540602 [Bacillus rossius redtenbacheri]|uniref:uncharacterized protein LOC134540602 n=1 Tax=Bacillus rossius redtenbacheri TaxID=93214 RepID=UPI002FDE6538